MGRCMICSTSKTDRYVLNIKMKKIKHRVGGLRVKIPKEYPPKMAKFIATEYKVVTRDPRFNKYR